MTELSYLLFQLVLVVSCGACVSYLMYFISQRKWVRTVARRAILLSGILQTLYILFRLIQSGHTPITSQHEAVVF
ncbi:MAG: c-type cytochrome biogenesis protein CcsB, partial [Thermodesulfobacteriota bacterium]